jgi:hypothetical protein
MKWSFVLILILFFNLSARASELRSFSTDYCTNYPEGTTAQPDLWKHCCLIHDLNFWAGGEKKDRRSADLSLRSCIEATGAFSTAQIMYWAVRAGSLSPIKYPDKRWGNGWPGRKVHLPLTRQEIERIDVELRKEDSLPFTIKEDFVRSLYLRLDGV